MLRVREEQKKRTEATHGKRRHSNDSSKLQGQSLVQLRSVCLGGYWREGAYRSYRLIKPEDEKGNVHGLSGGGKK